MAQALSLEEACSSTHTSTPQPRASDAGPGTAGGSGQGAAFSEKPSVSEHGASTSRDTRLPHSSRKKATFNRVSAIGREKHWGPPPLLRRYGHHEGIWPDSLRGEPRGEGQRGADRMNKMWYPERGLDARLLRSGPRPWAAPGCSPSLPIGWRRGGLSSSGTFPELRTAHNEKEPSPRGSTPSQSQREQPSTSTARARSPRRPELTCDGSSFLLF